MKIYIQFLLIAMLTSIGCVTTLLGQKTTYKGKIKEIKFNYPSDWSIIEYEYSKYNQQVVVTAPKYNGWFTITVDTTSKTLNNLYKEKVFAQYKNAPDVKEGDATINGNAAKWAGTFENKNTFNFKFTYLIIKNGKSYFFDGQGGNTLQTVGMSEQEQTLKEILKGFEIVK